MFAVLFTNRTRSFPDKVFVTHFYTLINTVSFLTLSSSLCLSHLTLSRSTQQTKKKKKRKIMVWSVWWQSAECRGRILSSTGSSIRALDRYHCAARAHTGGISTCPGQWISRPAKSQHICSVNWIDLKKKVENKNRKKCAVQWNKKANNRWQ